MSEYLCLSVIDRVESKKCCFTLPCVIFIFPTFSRHQFSPLWVMFSDLLSIQKNLKIFSEAFWLKYMLPRKAGNTHLNSIQRIPKQIRMISYQDIFTHFHSFLIKKTLSLTVGCNMLLRRADLSRN